MGYNFTKCPACKKDAVGGLWKLNGLLYCRHCVKEEAKHFQEDMFKIKIKKKYKFKQDVHFKESNVKIAKGTEIHKNVIIMSGTVIKENCVIGSDVVIGNNCLLRNNVILKQGVSIGFSNAIEVFAYIRENTRTQGFCMISEYSRIGKNCFLGPYFNSMGDQTIGAPKGKYVPNPPIIGNKCRFGSGTKVVPGIKIQDGTVTGAMSLLTKDTKKNGLYYGVPAKFIKWMK